MTLPKSFYGATLKKRMPMSLEDRARGIIAENMQEYVKRLMRRLVQNTPRVSGHAVSEWKFCVGNPPTADTGLTDNLAYTHAVDAIEAWDGLKPAYIYNNARNKEYMYLILVNKKTAVGGAGPRFVERSIREAKKGIG